MAKNLPGSILSLFLYLVLFIMVLGVVTVVATYSYYQNEISKPVKIEDGYSFTISKGMSVDAIANMLSRDKIIANPYILKAYLYLNSDKIIQAGEFFIDSENANLVSIVDQMQTGTFDRKVTLLNGLRLEEYKEYLESEVSKEFADKFINSSYTEEGFMFPDTYIISLDVEPEVFAKRVRDTFNTKVKSKLNLVPNKHNLSEKEVVILASIVEREENELADMKMVAGILLNRLKNGWPLQADATIQYAIGKPGNWWPVLRGIDIDNDVSVFNSYKNRGLPPEPICNPGFDAIDAVINSTDSDNYFYMTGNDGITRYSETIEEHNENVAKYLK